MKHLRTLTAVLLVLALVLTSFATVLAEGEPEAEWDQLPLGNTGYAIKVPAGYTDLGVTDEQFALGMVSSYVNPDTGIDIDVTQYVPGTEGFEAFVEGQVALYNGSGLTMAEFKGIPAAGYYTEWVMNNETYYNATALFDTGAYYLEVDLNWYASAGDKTLEAGEILRTFGPIETEQIRLGSSPFAVTVARGYYNGEVTSEEAAEGLIAYYLNDNLLFDFDVYENKADESLTLADVAQQLCTVNKGTELVQQNINGIEVYTFSGHNVYDEVMYDTVTCVFESTNGTYISILCWIDNEPMRYAANAMLATLTNVEDDVADEPMVLRIGSSDLCITLPTTFRSGAVSEEEFNEEGYAACYVSPYGLFDIDLYQCAVADELPTLEEFTEKDAADYNGTDIALDEEINGVHVTSYRSEEKYEGIDYHCANYTFEQKGYYYQLCFYWTDEDAAEDVEAVMETLAPIAQETIQIGRSPYSVNVPAGIDVKEFEDETMDLAYARYELSPLKFYVYDLISSEKHFPLDEFAALEAEYYKGHDLTFTEINGIPVAYYYYTRTDEQYNNYGVLTYCIENGENGYIDIDFYIDDYVGMFQALDVINSLTK